MEKHKAGARFLMAVLLITMMAATALGRFRNERASGPSDEAVQSDALTPDEEREAREVVERFVQRYHETKDLNPLIDEMFVGDYAARLQLQNLRRPMVQLQEGVPLAASPDEMRPFVLAVMNFWSLSLELETARAECAQDQSGCENSKPGPEDLFTPETLSFIRSEPRLARFVSHALEIEIKPEGTMLDEDRESVGNDSKESDDLVFRDVEEMNHLTSAMEKMVEMMRAHLRELPPKKHEARENEAASEDTDPTIDLEASVVAEGENFYGCPAGTRLICARVMWFHLDLIRLDGRLILLAISPLDD